MSPMMRNSGIFQFLRARKYPIKEKHPFENCLQLLLLFIHEGTFIKSEKKYKKVAIPIHMGSCMINNHGEWTISSLMISKNHLSKNKYKEVF